MSIKHTFYALCTAIFCLTANATEDFMLAYYVEVSNSSRGGKSVFQQHGRHFSTERHISIPTGRGGRGELSLSLVSVGESTGVLRLELFDATSDANAIRTPAYSLDVEFSKEGAKGDVVDSKGVFNVELSYTIVPKLNL